MKTKKESKTKTPQLEVVNDIFIYKSTENPIRRNNNIPCYVVGWG